MPKMNMPQMNSNRLATWLARFCFGIVFAWNIQCALAFIFTPNTYLAAYELTGTAGCVALQGIGIAFLMWNVTYPPFVLAPRRFIAFGGAATIQQVIGLVGETVLRLSLQEGHLALQASIDRFILFDGIGLVLMFVSLAALWFTASPNQPL